MRMKSMQMSLIDTYNDVNSAMENDKPKKEKIVHK